MRKWRYESAAVRPSDRQGSLYSCPVRRTTSGPRPRRTSNRRRRRRRRRSGRTRTDGRNSSSLISERNSRPPYNFSVPSLPQNWVCVDGAGGLLWPLPPSLLPPMFLVAWLKVERVQTIRSILTSFLSNPPIVRIMQLKDLPAMDPFPNPVAPLISAAVTDRSVFGANALF